MTQNEKDLLLKDLCARVPYGVKAISKIPINQNESKEIVGQVTSVHYNVSIVQVGGFDVIVDYNPYFEIKPYLFPISSMTEEQKEEYYSLADDVTLKRGEGSYFGIKIHCIKLGISDNPHEGVWDDVDLDAIDWLNKNHFDYRGLIEKGLAIDATGLNIY